MPTRTFIFTDVVGSSALKGHRHFGPDERTRNENYFRNVNQPHLTRLRNCIAIRHGQFIKDVGDCVFAAFESPTDAVRCGIEMQRSLRDDAIPTIPGERLRIRIGLHSGEAVEYQTDFHGRAVDMTARVENAAGADQIIMTDSTRLLCGVFTDIAFHRIGEFDLRGVGRTVLTEVDWDKNGPRLTQFRQTFDAEQASRRIQEAQRPNGKRLAVTELIEELPKRIDPTERYWIYTALGKIGGKQAFAALRTGFTDEHEHAREGAREALQCAGVDPKFSM